MKREEILNVVNILNNLIQTNSRIEKEEILKNNENNTELKEVLKYLCNKLRISGISVKKISKFVEIESWEESPSSFSFSELLHYFDTHNTGTDVDIAWVQNYCVKMSEYCNKDYEMVSFLFDIVTKSLKIGVDKKTVNKVYGENFIPTLDVMLGTSIEHVKLKEGTWFSISQKLNGTRCFYYRGQLYSRSGKVFTGLEHIITDLKNLDNLFNIPYVYDGELILKDRSLGDSKSFQISAGLANSDEEDKSSLMLIIFDSIPLEQFENHSVTDTYKYRKGLLNEYRQIIHSNGSYGFTLNNVDVVPMFYEGTDQNEIDKWLEYAENNDMEGIMLNLDTPYEYKRTKNLIKCKRFYTLDLRVIGVEAGTGRNEGRLGALIVDYKGNKVKVGSGFSDQLRDYFWEFQNEIIGQIIEVKYKEQTKNKEGTESLQFPVFVRIRDDKNEVSYE